MLALLCCFFSLRLAGGVLGLGLMTAVISFLLRGMIEKTYLFLKVREYINGSGPGDWLMWGATTLLVMAVLYMVGLLGYWVAFLVLSGAAAGCIRVLIDKPLAQQRKEPIEDAEQLLRDLRLKGLPEESVRQFVCKYSGTHWEEFYEALFGYEALLVARKLWSRPEGGKPRPSYAAWRDPLVQWIDARQRARKEARERKHLQEVERKKLQAEGVSASEAQAKASETASVMVSAAAEIKQQTEQRAVASDVGLEETAAVSAPVNAKMLMEAAEKPTSLPPEIKKKLEEKPKPSRLALGSKIRFLAGAVLVVFCFLWMNQNALIPSSEVDFKTYLINLEKAGNLTFFPAPLDKVFSGFHVGFAGLVLVLSSLMRSGKLLFFVFLAVIVSMVGPLLVPDDLGANPSFVALVAGLAVFEFGVVFNRAARARP
jgi:eukaryotic-like serine/threonine-protein kinase